MRVGILLILFGAFLIFMGTFVTFLEAIKSEKAEAEYAGFVFIGPFPIGVASSRQMAYLALALGFLFLLLLLFSKW